jgi:hypothetical protein
LGYRLVVTGTLTIGTCRRLRATRPARLLSADASIDATLPG